MGLYEQSLDNFTVQLYTPCVQMDLFGKLYTHSLTPIFLRFRFDLHFVFPQSAEGQPPSVLSLAYRAVCCDNPRQLKLHLAVIGEAILQSVEGAGLLGEACECGSDGCVRVLLDSGCLPNSSSRADGMSAIHLAAQNDHAWYIHYIQYV